MARPSYDVLIAGAGPAGSACAILLARRGLRVLLVDGGVTQGRPAEVFAPATLRLIRELNLPLPGTSHPGAPCRGVMSLWGTDDPEFYDYELYGCGAGITVDRGLYDEALIAAARSAGARTVRSRVHLVDGDSAGWHVAIGSDLHHARVFVDACGRAGRGATGPTGIRSYRDRLVSFSMWQRAGLHEDVLLLEAVDDGWWYVSHHEGNVSSVVYLSDADLVPRTEQERSEHLRRSFANTRLIRESFAIELPFETHRGADARTGRRASVADARWFVVGDAAFSMDPLSGEGTRLALESARAAIPGILKSVEGEADAHLDFRAWCDDTERHQLTQRQRAYWSVHTKWHQSAFWRRRIDDPTADVSRVRDAASLQPAGEPTARGPSR